MSSGQLVMNPLLGIAQRFLSGRPTPVEFELTDQTRQSPKPRAREPPQRKARKHRSADGRGASAPPHGRPTRGEPARAAWLRRDAHRSRDHPAPRRLGSPAVVWLAGPAWQGVVSAPDAPGLAQANCTAKAAQNLAHDHADIAQVTSLVPFLIQLGHSPRLPPKSWAALTRARSKSPYAGAVLRAAQQAIAAQRDTAPGRTCLPARSAPLPVNSKSSCGVARSRAASDLIGSSAAWPSRCAWTKWVRAPPSSMPSG